MALNWNLLMTMFLPAMPKHLQEFVKTLAKMIDEGRPFTVKYTDYNTIELTYPKEVDGKIEEITTSYQLYNIMKGGGETHVEQKSHKV